MSGLSFSVPKFTLSMFIWGFYLHKGLNQTNLSVVSPYCNDVYDPHINKLNYYFLRCLVEGI